MSFQVNNIELQEIYFNNQMVKSAYYNNELVWTSQIENYTWVGWDNATWEDIYNLCKVKQAGIITEWPSDVVLGATKTASLSETILGSDSLEMMLIGTDIDGTGVLTFHSKKVMANLYNNTVGKWGSVDDLVYNAIEAAPYIKTLSKNTLALYWPINSSTATRTTTTEDKKVWLPSYYEMGLEPEYYGATNITPIPAPYQYYENKRNIIKYDDNGIARKYFLRGSQKSYRNDPVDYACVLDTGCWSYTKFINSNDTYYAPAFAIG